MSETIILIAVISNMLLTPMIQYLLSSRCYEVECCCIKCKRNPIDMEIEDVEKVGNKERNTQNI